MVHKEILPTPSITVDKGVFTFYGEATIKASAREVYDAVTDFQSYSKWNQYTPSIKTPSDSNNIKVDDIVTLQYRPEPTGKTLPVPCRIISISEADLSICWRGMAYSLPSWILLPEKIQKVTSKGENECLYQIYETQAGPLAHVVKWQLGNKLSAMNQGIADNLKAYVEGSQSVT